MNYLQFLDAGVDRTLSLPGTYNPILVFISILIASLAAYAALGLAGRIKAAENKRTKLQWLGAGATAMGIGIWAMHFVGMLAFRLPIAVAYDLGLTLLSVAPAVIASSIVLFVTSRAEIRPQQLVLAGAMMGLGIGAMHYTGMAAMRMASEMYYDPLLFAGSLVVAVALATAALYIHFLAGAHHEKQSQPLRFVAAATMGGAVAGMHYTAMAAAYFFPSSAQAPTGGVVEPTLLAILVGLAAAVILSFAIFVVLIDTRLKAAAHSVRTSRARLTHAIESISEGFCLYDAEDRLVLCNSKYRELAHHGNAEVIGETFEDLLCRTVEQGLIPLAEREADEWIAHRLKHHRSSSAPHIQQRSDGRWLQIDERRTDDEGTVAIYTDITELKKAELELGDALESLKGTQSQLVQTERMAALGQLTAGIAHEMNSPIGVVSSSADSFERCVGKILATIENSHTLDEVRSDQSFQKSVEIIRENSHVIVEASQRIAKIVGSLKTFTNFDQRAFESINIHARIEDALALVQHKIRGGVRVRKAYGDVPKVWCNPSELTQVFMTLLTNSTQAIDDEGEINIETAHIGESVCISFTDTGRGIPSDRLDKLFEFVFTSSGARVHVGMGLPTAYNIVHRHGGEISVSSELNRGTKIRIELPLARTRPPEVGSAGPVQPEVGSKDRPLQESD